MKSLVASATAVGPAPELLPIAILGEGLEGPLDEAYVSFTHRIAAALARRTEVIEISLPRRRLGAPPALLRAARRARAAGAGTLIYCSRSSCTLPALLRARLLRLSAPELTHVFVGLQPRAPAELRPSLARRLWPDLLLVGTTAERDRLRQLGARAELVAGGVDLDRFRPPVDTEERRRLRARWGLPLGVHLVLHVGHATRGRNLEALSALTGLPDLRVLALLSSRGESAAAPVVEDLRRRGAIVRQGYLVGIEELYRASDCYVMPTPSTDRVVAFPLSVLEALASGLPVVTAPVGALPERFAGEPGVRFFTAAGGLPALVRAQLAARPRTRHLALPFSWQAQADAILDSVAALRERGRRRERV